MPYKKKKKTIKPKTGKELVITEVKKKEIKKRLKKKIRRPKTNVEKSERFLTYDSWVRSGWPATLCERKALELFGENISHDSFNTYRKKLPAEYAIHKNVLRSKLGDIDIVIDELSELDVLIAHQENRIAKGLKFEDKAPLPIKEINDMIDTLKDLLELRARLVGKIKGTSTTVAVQNNNTFEVPPATEGGLTDEELNDRIGRILKGRPAFEDKKE